MAKERGNLDDLMPPASFGTSVGHFAIAEIALWAVVGVLLLAFEGGVIGFIIAAAIAIFVGLAWRDLARRAKNPIQEQRRGDE